MQEMMSVTQAAEQLGLDRRTVQRRLERGEMRGTRVHEKLWLIPREEVERWHQFGRLKPGPKPKRRPTEDKETTR